MNTRNRLSQDLPLTLLLTITWLALLLAIVFMNRERKIFTLIIGELSFLFSKFLIE